MKDPTTGVNVLHNKGNTTPFIHQLLQKPCSVAVSKLKKDDPHMRELWSAAEKLYANYAVAANAMQEEISALEISLRYDDLFILFYRFVHQFALGHVIIKRTMDGGFARGMKLDTDELANKVAYTVLAGYSQEQAATFSKQTGTALAADYATTLSYDHQAAEAKWDATADGAFVTTVADHIRAWCHKCTTVLWAYNTLAERKRSVNAELRKVLKPQAQTRANQDVEDAMDTADASAPLDKVADVVRKETRKQVGQEVRKIKAQLRKKYSGDDKTNQPSTPVRGRKSSGASATSQKSSAKASRTKSKQPKSVLKKGKDVKFSSDTRTSPRNGRTRSSSRSRGNRGASSGGGRGRDAGRR